MNWVWIHADAERQPDAWKRLLSRLREAGIEAVLLCVYGGQEAAYGSRHLPVSGPVLERVLDAARDVGMAVHAWMFTLLCNVPSVRQGHPDWYTVSREGRSTLTDPPYVDYYRWLCPSNPEVRAFVQQTVGELAAYEEVAGIHLDYIRFADLILPEALQPTYGLVQDGTDPRFDFCYCTTCRTLFEGATGMDIRALPDPMGDVAWMRFREERITALVGDLAEQARLQGKPCTAAVFATPEQARTGVRQDWPRWDLDAVFPMIYHGFYGRDIDWIQTACEEGVTALPKARPLYAGLYLPEISPSELPVAIDRARAGGAAGVSLFSAGELTPEHLEQVRMKISNGD